MDTIRDIEMAPPESSNVPQVLPLAIRLSREQRDVLDMVKSGKSVFFTGSAGAGKSVLLREIISHLRFVAKQRGWDSHNIAVTASTGIAAINIGGCTLHSWAGINLGKGPVDKLINNLWASHTKRKSALPEVGMVNDKIQAEVKYGHDDDDDDDEYLTPIERWRRTRVLIIDEVSMLDGELFDKLEAIARNVRRTDLPFGGMQVILSGDFFQLPPVPDRLNGREIPAKFAFQAESWKICIRRTVILHQVFRQRDEKFVKILNDMRFGIVTPETERTLQRLSRKVHYADGIEPTDLFPTKREVDRRNHACLALINSKPHEYYSVDLPGLDEFGKLPTGERLTALLDRMMSPSRLILKVGAQVMLIKNFSQEGLVNGSIGRVVDFMTAYDAWKQSFTIYLTESHREPGVERNRSQKPHIPATVFHSPRVWPLVQFQSGQTMLCIPINFEIHNALGRVEAQRIQVPLLLAWALSIHKSQGQTLERVRVDLKNIFECGQAYVALSRAVSMEGLQVLNFRASQVRADRRVREWMEEEQRRGEIDEVQADIDFWAEEMDVIE